MDFPVLPNGHEGGSIAKSVEQIQTYVDLVNSEGLELAAYEGGQHIAPVHNGMENNQAIVDLFIAANRDFSENDVIQLKGIASDYSLQTLGGNTHIFLGSGNGAELIGIVEGEGFADFTSGFSF